MRRDDRPFNTRLGAGRPLADYEQREARMWIERLEAAGYVVRKPSEADLESVLEIEQPGRHSFYEMGIRLDTMFNGTPYALMQRFPFEMVLDPDDSRFREHDLPRIFANEIAHHLADKLMPGIVAQVKAKIDPLVPEKRMSLDEIVSFIANALGTTKHRVDPTHYDEKDQRKPPA